MKNIIIPIILLFSQLSYGQVATDSIVVDTTLTPVEFELISTYHDGQIIMRWGPSNPESFVRSIAQPFLVEKFDLTPDSGKVVVSSRKEIIVQPWGEAEFEPYLDEDEPFILTAGQVMYGETASKEEGFAVAYEDVLNRYGLALLAADMDVEASRAMAWRFEDADVEQGRRYFYRVQLLDTTILSKPFYTSELAQNIDLPVPQFASVIEEEANVGLYWSKEDYREIYTGFHIERSADGNNYERLTSVPIVAAYSDDYVGEMTTYRDSIDNYNAFYYRLVGITPFGFESSPSAPLMAMARDRTPPASPLNVYIDTEQETGAVHISWELPEDSEIANVEVFRSFQFDVAGTSISGQLSRDTEGYRDTIRDNIQFHYYQVATVDTAGNYATTIPHIASFRDTIPPSPPTGLVGEIDTNGIVSISWNENYEPDLMGYNVYFANKANHMYANLSQKPRRDTFFIDTLQLNTTTEEIFYKIVAVDFNYHVSEFSIPLRLEKPDFVAPLPPRFKSYDQDEGIIMLDMITSKAKDSESQILYRKSMNDSTYTKIGAIIEGVMIDSTIAAGVTYAYKALVTDDDGLEAFSEVFITAKDTKKPNAPESLQAIYDAKSKSVNLSWSEDEMTSSYIIYRSMDDGPFVKIMTTDESRLKDRRMLIADHQYSYKVKSENRKGIRSTFTEPVVVSITNENPNNE